MLDGIAGRFVVLWGWRRLLAAFVAGAVSAVGLPPLDLFPVLFLTFPVLVWLLDGTVSAGRRGWLSTLAAAGAVGWAFGFGYFLAGLYWIGAAFLVEADLFGWMMPFAIVILPAGLALFTAAGTIMARAMWSPGPRRVFALAVGLAVSEFARAHVLTGFSWNAFGYTLTGSPILMQAAAFAGIYGLTLFAVFIFAAPAALSGEGSRAARVTVPLTAVALLAVLAGTGAYRLAGADNATIDGLTLRIVQPAIRQDQKWLPKNRSAIFATYLELSDTAASPEVMGVGDVDLLIWPESALPFVFDSEPEALSAIAALLPERTTLVTGMQRIERDQDDARGYRVYNSIMVIDAAGEIRDVYDKVRLVPFGEFLPFQDWLEALGFEQLTRIAGGFSPGTDSRPMQAGAGPPFQPLICYEIIFPGAVVDIDNRPGFMLNVTNDGWFGDSPGPWQHLRQARLRAVEEGLPVVRAANTGISAVIDPYGRLQGSLSLGVGGVLDATLPEPLPPPPFAIWGTVIPGGIAVVFSIIAIRLERRYVYGIFGIRRNC
jgi:apolipoprotein N-acyltransferase